MKYPAYTDYKDSPIPWLPKVPSNWEVHRLKWAVTSCDNGVWGEEADGGPDDVACIRVADFDRLRCSVSADNLTMRSIEARQRASRQVRKGDLLIEKSGGGEKQLVGCVVRFDHEFPAVCSNFVARMGVADGQNSRYWTYAHAALYAGRLNDPAIKQTTGIQNLDAGEYLNNLFAYAPAEDQEKIATFLDWRTAQVDALIAKKRTLIERLREQRQSLIAHHVTRGLNLQASTRENSIPWLQHMPAHWDAIPLGFLTSMSGGMTPSMNNPAYWDGDVPWVTPKDMKQAEVSDATDHITDLALSETGLSLVPPGSILIVVRGMILAHSFPTAMVRAPVTINQDMKALRCTDRLDGDYLFWCLNGFADVLINQAQESAHGTKKMETETIKKFVLPVPPVEEQRGIAKQLSNALQKLDESSRLAIEAINRLTEYRSALITAAVIGQIDVRGVKVPAPI